MKTFYKTMMTLNMCFLLMSAMHSQTVATFDSLPLAADSYWNGSDMPMGTYFTDGHAIFPNVYDTVWGGFWAEGWAYSNMTDTVTEGFMNMYSAITGSGYGGSANYAIGMEGSVIELTGPAAGKVVAGFYVTNGTYAALSMRHGDMVGKPFGGSDGNDPDWFLLTIYAYHNGSLKQDSVNFYLADYRFADNSLNYIVDTWEWVDLTSLGNVDSLLFTLSSSDVGDFGMNTPGFFCIDNFTTTDSYASIAQLSAEKETLTLYPNPTQDYVNIQISDAFNSPVVVDIYNLLGQHFYTARKEKKSPLTIAVGILPQGTYLVRVSANNHIQTKTFIKK